MTLTLLIVLITSFPSCETTAEMEIPQQKQKLDIPTPPVMKSVNFADQPDDGGLFISYENYRNLENNIIEYRRYIKELEKQIRFYRGEILIE